jgi:tRNA A37 threonylcarbamoyladenosine dehydratase
MATRQGMQVHKFSRTEKLIGSNGLTILENSKVAVFGVGGVGSFAAEALARAGIGTLMLVDFDVICVTNINRQIPALHSTVGRPKVEVMKERIIDINPSAQVIIVKEFYSSKTADSFFAASWDYILDAVDDVAAKVDLIYRAKQFDIPIISSMGAGNRLEPYSLRVTDISETKGCPLARAVRKELRSLGINSGVAVVSSTDPPLKPFNTTKPEQDIAEKSDTAEHRIGRKTNFPGSISFVPSIAGLLMAAYVVNYLIKKEE